MSYFHLFTIEFPTEIFIEISTEDLHIEFPTEFPIEFPTEIFKEIPIGIPMTKLLQNPNPLGEGGGTAGTLPG